MVILCSYFNLESLVTGEKLRQLDDKAADLEQSAMNFAAMAQQLKEQEQKKAMGRWW